MLNSSEPSKVSGHGGLLHRRDRPNYRGRHLRVPWCAAGEVYLRGVDYRRALVISSASTRSVGHGP